MAEPSYEELLRRLQRTDAKVVIAGLGYVGLPLAVAVAGAGHQVTGIDVWPERVDDVNHGTSRITDVVPAVLAELVAGGRLRATTDYREAASAEVAVIAVPTPIDEFNVPDLEAVKSAVESLAAVMRPGSLVVLESTTYPGTTDEIVLPAFTAHGLRPGTDVFIGYSPERIDPTNQVWTLANTPKVVSGLTPRCLELVKAFYGSFVETLVPVSDFKTAEITKLFENIFRVVNIALVNELQVICEAFDIDVWEVVEACSTKPFGFMPFYPGPGLGGHCVPVDPFALAYKAREKGVNAEFIELAGKVNAAMPAYVVNKAAQLLNAQRRSMAGANVGLLGVAYKKNTGDMREAPAIKVVEILSRAGAKVSYLDPQVPEFEAAGLRLRSQPDLARFLAAQDCVIIVTDHDAIDWDTVQRHADKVVDTRNALRRLRAVQAGPVRSAR
jgi:UDP-N-acetyl-D-glucosamine dehydrogenase